MSLAGTSSEGQSIAASPTVPSREELLKARDHFQALLNRMPSQESEQTKNIKPANTKSLVTDVYDYHDEESNAEDEFFDNIEDPACQFNDGYVALSITKIFYRS